MKFVYKIWSKYDGFVPARLEERLEDDGLLRLGWGRYLEAVEEGAEVWVFFHGPHKFEDGVYVIGAVEQVDHAQRCVFIRPSETSSTDPLVTPAITEQVREIVRARAVQVFVLPEGWAPEPECSLASALGAGCETRRCELCSNWRNLPLIEPDHLAWPRRLAGVEEFVPAYWVVPSRCYLYRDHKPIASSVSRSSNLFGRFKVGEEKLAFPLALGIFNAMNERCIEGTEAVVPIPLSPDKVEAGELHRTLLLAEELGTLLRVPVLDALTLAQPVSKGRVLRDGGTQRQFEREYSKALQVDESVRNYDRLLLLDDVATKGSTLRVGARRIHAVAPDLSITAVTSGQMILKGVVLDEAALVAPT